MPGDRPGPPGGSRRLALRRAVDGLVYYFAAAAADPRLYLRSDLAVQIRFVDRIGWAACDAATGEISGLPWAVPLADQSADHPPQGVWVSCKQDKSYVYDLQLIVEPR